MILLGSCWVDWGSLLGTTITACMRTSASAMQAGLCPRACCSPHLRCVALCVPVCINGGLLPVPRGAQVVKAALEHQDFVMGFISGEEFVYPAWHVVLLWFWPTTAHTCTSCTCPLSPV